MPLPLLLSSGDLSLKSLSFACVFWLLASHGSPFVLTLTRNLMWRDTACICDTSIVQHQRLFRFPAGWLRGQRHWDNALLFCSHDGVANKAPRWFGPALWKPTITLDIDDVIHSHKTWPLQGQRGHERPVIKVVGEVVFVSRFFCTNLPLCFQCSLSLPSFPFV